MKRTNKYIKKSGTLSLEKKKKNKDNNKNYNFIFTKLDHFSSNAKKGVE